MHSQLFSTSPIHLFSFPRKFAQFVHEFGVTSPTDFVDRRNGANSLCFQARGGGMTVIVLASAEQSYQIDANFSPHFTHFT